MKRITLKSQALTVFALLAALFFSVNAHAADWEWYPIQSFNWSFLFADQGNTCGSATEVKLVQASTPNRYSGISFGNISDANDVDWFVVELPAHQYGMMTVETTGNTDTFGSVYMNSCSQTTCKQCVDNNSGDNLNFAITVGSGNSINRLYIKVQHVNKGTGPYVLNINFAKWS